MAEAESEEAVRLRNNSYKMLKSLKVAGTGSEESVRLRNKASKMLKSPSSIGFPSSKEHKSSYSLSKSLAEMVDEDPIRLQNQSCAIRRETVLTREWKYFVYSSLACLPTFSIGLSSFRGEKPPPASLRKNSVDPKDRSPLRYFQMPELSAKVFVGNVDGFDTVTCHLLGEEYDASQSDLDSESVAVRSVYKGDCRGKLSRWTLAQHDAVWRSEQYFNLILSGTELVSASNFNASPIMVGNLGGKSSKVSGSSSDYEDCGGDETIRQSSDVVEQPEDHVPAVRDLGQGYWGTDERPRFFRLPEGSYLRKPEFTMDDQDIKSYDRSERHVFQLTKFDDFIILGNKDLYNEVFRPHDVIDIVRKNAFETADVIAAQLVKGFKEKRPCEVITVIVILLDHKEILRKEEENMAPKDTTLLSGVLGPKAISQSMVLRDDKEIAESKEEEIVTLKEEEKGFASKMEDKKGIMMEEDHEVKILVGEPLPNVPQISTVSLDENEDGMKSTTISSKLTSVEMQDNSEASSSTILIDEDDCKNEDFIVSRHMTKWIIYGDPQERTLLCFFNVEEKEYEFYFEDHESMATIIGLGVPHSKVVLEYGSPHVTVVEIPKEDWDVVWAHSNDIPLSIPEGNVLKQEIFPDILHCIAKVINIDNIVSKANDGGVEGNNGKDKLQGNDDNNDKGKGKAHDHDDHGNTYGNTSHPNGGSNDAPDDNDNKERKEKDGNDEEKDSCNQDDEKTSNVGKEVQAIVYLELLPGGDCKMTKKIKELWESFEEGKNEKTKELEKVHEGEKKKKKKYLPPIWRAPERSKSDNVVGNQQKLTTTHGVEDGDDQSLLKQLDKQIHAQMVFTFTIKYETGGPFKTIQATIKPITFQLHSKTKKKNLNLGRFGWFHGKLKVAFGVVDQDAARLDPESYKVLDSSQAEKTSSQGTSNGNSKTSTNVFTGKMGLKYGIIASGEYNRTNGSEAKTTEEVLNTWKTNEKVTEGDFFFSCDTNLNSQQLKYSYHPRSPFKKKEFEEISEGDRLEMCHLNPICQSQQVSCEGIWQPKNSRNLEEYKLKASRELGMTKIYNLEPEIVEEKKQKEVRNGQENLPPCIIQKLEMTRIYNPEPEIVEEKKQKEVRNRQENLPLCFTQKLEKVVYLNHSMSHLDCSSSGVYRLRERNNPSTYLTQAQSDAKPNWPKNNPLVDMQ